MTEEPAKKWVEPSNKTVEDFFGINIISDPIGFAQIRGSVSSPRSISTGFLQPKTRELSQDEDLPQPASYCTVSKCESIKAVFN